MKCVVPIVTLATFEGSMFSIWENMVVIALLMPSLGLVVVLDLW
jgi:hypothetical protein